MNVSVLSIFAASSLQNSPFIAVNSATVRNSKFTRFFPPFSLSMELSVHSTVFSRFLSPVVIYSGVVAWPASNVIDGCVFSHVGFGSGSVIRANNQNGVYKVTRTAFMHNYGTINQNGCGNIVLAACRGFTGNQLCFLNTTGQVAGINAQYQGGTASCNMNNTVSIQSLGNHAHIVGASAKLVFHLHNSSYAQAYLSASLWWHSTVYGTDQVKFIQATSSTGGVILGTNFVSAGTRIHISHFNVVNVTATAFCGDQSCSLTVYNAVVLSVPASIGANIKFVDSYLFNASVEYTLNSFKIEPDRRCIVASSEFTVAKRSMFRSLVSLFLLVVSC